MMKEFPKKYDHGCESELYQERTDKKLFQPKKPKKSSSKKAIEQGPFVVSMPPPNVTGVLHAGHALGLTIQDIFARYFRNQGRETLWIPGTDHAGIATQVKVENHLMDTQKKSRFDLGREQFLAEIRKRVYEKKNIIVEQTKASGASCDRSREQFTLSENLSRAVRKSFSTLFEKGKIYQSDYIVNRSPGVKSVIADTEIEEREENGKLYYIKYFTESKGEPLIVATTRPETIFADVALAVNPLDKRYKKYIGKNVVVPIVNRLIPVIGDPAVDITFGTGVLKITPTHDANDFEVAKRHNLRMDIFALDRECIFTEFAGEFAGKPLDKYFDNVIQYLGDIGNIEKIVDYTHMVPYCERSGQKIQPMLSKQRFVDVKEIADKSIDLVDQGEITFYPEKAKERFTQRMKNIRPRCISRQLWWGHRIPIWYGESGSIYTFDEDKILSAIPKKTKLHTIFSLIIFNLIADSRLPNPFNIEQIIDVLFAQSVTPNGGNVGNEYISLYEDKCGDTYQKEISLLKDFFNTSTKKVSTILEKGGDILDLLDKTAFVVSEGDLYRYDLAGIVGEKSLRHDEDVLDTWFSSALWPFATLGRPEKTSDFERYYPTTLLETGKDILNAWVARMIMMGLLNTDQKPFSHVYLHGLVVDEKGQKFSKSLGNGVDPLDIIKKYGADAMRLSLVIGSTPGNNISFYESKVEYYRRFLNKLRNATRFVYTKVLGEKNDVSIDLSMLRDDLIAHQDQLNDFDHWLLSLVNKRILHTKQSLENYQIGECAHEIIHFLWHIFCDWFIEITKIEKSGYTDKVILFSLGTMLQLLNPYIPFVTEKLWDLLGFEGKIYEYPFPETFEGEKNSQKITIFMEIISQSRELRNTLGVKPHEEIEMFLEGNENILEFIKKYDSILKTLLKVQYIEYTYNFGGNKSDYAIKVILDIVVGVKTIHTTVIDWKDQLHALEKNLDDETQFLQSLRNTLTSPGFVDKAPKKVVAEKQEKMKEIKQKIALLEKEINKIKMEHK